MDLRILNPKIQAFISKHIGNSMSTLALMKNPFPEMDWMMLLQQIESKTKAKEKLPLWFTNANIIYPPKISLEQTSSEKTAAYKAEIVQGDHLIDLTGGFGVDDYFFAKKIKEVTHCEINTELAAIVQHNFNQLGVKNCSFLAGDSLDFLHSSTQNWDWIYIDPSRRNEQKGKVFLLQDCLPNVPDNLDFYFEKSNSILIKTAPLLDIVAGMKELRNIKNIHIVALENEVKELLWELDRNYDGPITIKTVNLTKEKKEEFDFVFNQNIGEPEYHLPQNYLYEPNSAIMKSGGFESVAIQFQLHKLHKHSHLYTAENCIPFPGRVFEIQTTFSYSKKEMKRYLENRQCHVTTRNFPESVASIRKKWKLKEGGNLYCFFTTDMKNDKIVLICAKI